MSKIALRHRTRYAFDRLVGLGPHEVRLRPAPHARTPVERYSLGIRPAKHFLHWQQDPHGNWVARLLFPERTRALEIAVDLVADMAPVNPFDFFVDPAAVRIPFAYEPESAVELAPCLAADPATPRLAHWLAQAGRAMRSESMGTVECLVWMCRRVRDDVEYLTRAEPGIQPPEYTLERGAGSCRDSAWLLTQILRGFGLAARFVSGYLVQLAADPESSDRADLHAWCEAYVPGAGWIGLDATSGLLAGEAHIPLACGAVPASAAPLTGKVDPCESSLSFEMSVTRLGEDAHALPPFRPPAIRAPGPKFSA